jgi:hypothetical protein
MQINSINSAYGSQTEETAKAKMALELMENPPEWLRQARSPRLLKMENDRRYQERQDIVRRLAAAEGAYATCPAAYPDQQKRILLAIYGYHKALREAVQPPALW